MCRYSSEKKEYEFYDTKKLKEYEGYLKLSGLKDSVKIVNKRREYEYAKESQKYKDDRATANKEQIRLGEALARFNYPQLYQTYIFQGGEKDPEAFENSEGFKFRENKFISDLKNSGVEFGGKYELYDGNRYITSLKNYEDLAKFSGVASKNGIKLTMSEIYTSALLTQHDTRPLKIDIKGSAIAGEEITVVAEAVMSRNQLDKMPKYGKPKNKVETEKTEQRNNPKNDTKSRIEKGDSQSNNSSVFKEKFNERSLNNLGKESIQERFNAKFEGSQKGYKVNGDYNKALEDFKSLNPKNIKEIVKPNGMKVHTGDIEIGGKKVKVIVRNSSSKKSNYTPTLEFQEEGINSYKKIRYVKE